MIGTTVGRYQVVAKLGAGGMGEVYRARDPRLGRDVAIKVLAPALHADPAATGRFEQEARAASALQHPAIVAVFDIGTENGQPYLVTELLEGLTLRERLAKSSMTVREALDIAIQIAKGLAAAHRAGIVHRDIKPENLFLTRTGARILDFGIARLTAARPVNHDDTPTALASSAGVMVGTVGYMAPEQVRGGDVDARADIFALGCVLHEMLSGTRTFERTTAMDTIAAILSAPAPELPPPPAVPVSLARLVHRCLQKEPDDRMQSAGDVAFALTDLRDDPAGVGATATTPRGPARTLTWTTAAAALAATVLAGWALTSRRDAPAPIALDTQTVVAASARPIAPAIAPDGKWIAYVSTAGQKPDLLVQFLSGGPPVNLTRDTALPIQNRTVVGGIDIAPDGAAIGVAGPPRPTGLWTIPGVFAIPAPLGGPPQRVGEGIASIRWSPDGRRIAAVKANPLVGDGVVVANADGSDLRVLVPARGGVHMHQVAWGADSRHIYYARSIEAGHTLGDIRRVAVAGGPPEVVVRTSGVAMFPAPTPDGLALIYAGDHNGEGLNLWQHRFDGSPDVRLTTGSGEYTEPFVSRDGTSLVCLARRRTGEIVRIDVNASEGSGAATVVGASGSSDGEPSASPATDRVFVTSTRHGRRRIWSIDAMGSQVQPITTGDALDWRPAVSPDGTRVAFTSNRGGTRGIWVVAADGGTPRSVVTGDVLDRVSWSPDGRRLVYALGDDTGSTIWTVAADGGTPQQVPGVTGRVPAWSPKGDSIAIIGATDGRPEVHFVTASGATARSPLSIEPVSLPTSMAWSPDGASIALISLPGRAAAEVFVLAVADGALRALHRFAAPAELDGVTWTPDGKAVLVGRRDYESEVLLMRGLRYAAKP